MHRAWRGNKLTCCEESTILGENSLARYFSACGDATRTKVFASVSQARRLMDSGSPSSSNCLGSCVCSSLIFSSTYKGERVRASERARERCKGAHTPVSISSRDLGGGAAVGNSNRSKKKQQNFWFNGNRSSALARCSRGKYLPAPYLCILLLRDSHFSERWTWC